MEIDVNTPLENPKLKELFAKSRNAGGRANDSTCDIMEAIANTVSPYLGDKLMDMIPYGDEFAYQAIDGIKPFYRKKQGLWSSLFGR